MSGSARRLTEKSIRQRLILSMSAGFLVILTIFSVGLWGYATQAANKAYDRLLQGAALAILERVNLASDEIRVDIPYTAFKLLGLAEDDRVFYRIFTEDGETITASHNLRPAVEYKPSDRPQYWDDAFSGETVRFMQQARLLTGDGHSLWVIVELGQTCIARRAMIADLFWRGFAVALFITIVGLIFVWIGINRVLHPLIFIERDLRHRDISDFTPLNITPPREVASLILSINSFIYRLKTNLEHSQSFIADVTHQIRTALSALHGQLELADREKDPVLKASRIEKAEKQSRNTIHLTNQLLAHAMVIHRADQNITSEFHLREVLKSTFETLLREHLKSDIDFTVDIAQDLEQDPQTADLITGDTISVREAIRNIIDNAIQHGPARNHIRISLQREGNEVILLVDDSGPGIPQDKIEKVLERFYSTKSEGDGSGLGLSIVEEVARSHGATLGFERSDMGGLRVRLAFKAKIKRGAE